MSRATAKRHTFAPQPPSAALDVYRRGMRAQMRLAHAAGLGLWAALIGRTRDVPDGNHRFEVLRATRPSEWAQYYPLKIQQQEAARVRIAKACLALIDAYHATLPHKPPARQPKSGEPVATYPRPQTERKRERSRAHRRWMQDRHLPTPPEPPAPRPPPVMSRTRPARIQPKPEEIEP